MFRHSSSTMITMCWSCVLKRFSPHISIIRKGHALGSFSRLLIISEIKAREAFVSFHASRIHTESTQVADEEQILYFLNTLTAEEMRQKRISSWLSELLCKHREAHGQYLTLKDVEKIKSIELKSFKTLCERLSAEHSDTKKLQGYSEDPLFKYTSPELMPSFIQSLSTVTSLEFSLESVYFATMSRDMQVLDWNHVHLQKCNYQKLTPSDILDQALDVYDQLPKSSIVLFENRSTRTISPAYFQYLLFLGRLQMALQTLINEDLPTSRQHKVFNVKDTFIVKTFDLRVGGERVSGQNIVQQIQNNEFSQPVSVAQEFWHQYNLLEHEIEKERYANCFLLSLAFCQHAFTDK